MKENPLVSIITVVFNGEKYLQHTIDSVASQTYKYIQYIIVDGGSTDKTIEIIKKNKDSVSKWISEKDKGIADAFNKGLALCEGDIVGLINADDWLEPNAIELIVRNFKDAGVVYGDSQFWLDGKPVAQTKSNHSKLRLGMTVSHSASFVKKEIYERLGGFNIKYKIAMDYDLFLRFFQSGVKFHGLGVVLTNMRRGGVSDERWLRAIKEELLIKNQYFSKYSNWYYFLRQFIIFSLKVSPRSSTSFNR